MKWSLLTMDGCINPPRPRSTNQRAVRTKEPGTGVGIVSRLLRGAECKDAGRRCLACTAPGAGWHGTTSAAGLGTRVRTGPNAATLIPALNQNPSRPLPTLDITTRATPPPRGQQDSSLPAAAYPSRNWTLMPSDFVKIALQLPGGYQERMGAHMIHFRRADRRGAEPCHLHPLETKLDEAPRLTACLQDRSLPSSGTSGPARPVRFQPAGDDQQSQPYLVTISSRAAGYQVNNQFGARGGRSAGWRATLPVRPLLLLLAGCPVRLQSHPDFESSPVCEGGRGKYRCAGGGVGWYGGRWRLLSPFDAVDSERGRSSRAAGSARAHDTHTIRHLPPFTTRVCFDCLRAFLSFPLRYHLQVRPHNCPKGGGPGDVPHLGISTTPEILLDGDMQSCRVGQVPDLRMRMPLTFIYVERSQRTGNGR